MEFLIIWLLCCIIFAGFGGWIAVQKHRKPEEGLILGFLFGPLGCLVEAVLPTLPAPIQPIVRPPTPEEATLAEQRKRDHEDRQREEAERRRRNAEASDQAFRRERARRQAERAQHLEQVRQRREASVEWFRATIVRFGWFKALPDVVQPMLIAAVICVPLVAVTVFAMQSLLPQPLESGPIAQVETPTTPAVPPTPAVPTPTDPGIAAQGSEAQDPLVSAPTPPPIPPESFRLAEKIGTLDVKSRRILGRFMGLGEGEVIYFDADEVLPRRMVADSLLMWKSLEPVMNEGRRMLPYYLEPAARSLLSSNPELYALRTEDLASDRQVVAAPTLEPDRWAEKMASLSDQSKSLLRRFQSNGLEAIIYLAPDEGPPKSLLELGAVVREPGAQPAGDKFPYVLSRRAKEVLRKNPELTGYTGELLRPGQ